jgi:hypothetical protein
VDKARASESKETGFSPWVPVAACALPTSQQPLRVAEFEDLFATTLRSVQWRRGRAPSVRLVLVGDGTLLRRVQRLGAAESACCSFFTFAVTAMAPGVTGGDRMTVAFDIEVPAKRADVLAGLVRRAERACEGAT